MLKTIRISGLNIKTHPHSPDSYVQLFERAISLQKPVNYHGNRYALLGSTHEKTLYDRRVITGQIYTFVDFDPTEDWLNTETNEPVSDDLKKEIELPQHLKPSFRKYEYIFFVNKHRLFFESKNTDGQSLGVSSLKRIFETIFSQKDVIANLEEVHVIPQAKHGALDEVLSISFMSRLYIEITRPNPDANTSSFNRKMLEKLDSQNAGKFEQKLSSVKDKSLEPDKETIELAKLATSDGEVISHGKNHLGRVITASTKDKPLNEPHSYDPKTHLPLSAFREGAIKLFSLLIGD
ncbi:DUF4747 family protein [Halomonas sp. McH1-25]|uniref:DUF4747 family protein n=1 Tax=unclassified Halomonas TaxID=2609666 RepID=UPI001EF73353|nr:DUF4747 family protein [Halomonas sp. McH1-25]MCP1342698.1 DUF4747 family protein [Halomonas sp. FL8]MCP1362169.1 DUF4747 family protein [Halomonas sp. BBD45]MCP1366379.1 DUF4747 family protein [Halomonas sp. BBD48]